MEDHRHHQHRASSGAQQHAPPPKHTKRQDASDTIIDPTSFHEEYPTSLNSSSLRYQQSEASDELSRINKLRDIHLFPKIKELLREHKTIFKHFAIEAIEDEYTVFSVGSKVLLTVFSLVIATSFLAVAILVGYFSHDWLGIVHVFVTATGLGVAGANYYFCIRHCNRANEVARAKLHERLGLICLLVCLALPLLQHEYEAFCLHRKRHYSTKERDCVGKIFPHSFILVMAFTVLLRFRPVVSTWVLVAMPVFLAIGRFINPVGTLTYFGFNVAVCAVVCLLCGVFQYVLDIDRRKKFSDLIILKQHQHAAKEARTHLDSTLESILPKSALSRLASGEPVMDVASNATISVCEIYDFVQWSTNLLPASIFQAVNALYSAFDEIIVKMKIEKLKAMGDLYVCSVGVQEPAFPEDAAKVIAFGIKQLMLVQRLASIVDSREPPNLRIGVHSGPAVGIMVGNFSLSYEIFGRTLDIAKQMTHVGPPGILLASQKALEYGVGERFESNYFSSLSPLASGSAADELPPGGFGPPQGGGGGSINTSTNKAYASAEKASISSYKTSSGNASETESSSLPLIPTAPLSTTPVSQSTTSNTPVLPERPDINAGLSEPMKLYQILGTVPESKHNRPFNRRSRSHDDFYDHPNAIDDGTRSPTTSPRYSSRNRSMSTQRRAVSARYGILLDHIKHARGRHSDTMHVLKAASGSTAVDRILGREEAAEIEANLTKVSKRCFFSTKFDAEDVQEAYMEYLRRVDKDDSTPVMMFLSLFLLSLFIVLVIEASSGVVKQKVGTMAFFACVVCVSFIRTWYRKFVVTPAVEGIVLILITTATYVAAALLNLSIINGEYQYLTAVFIPLIAHNCVRQPILAVVASIVFGSVVPMVVTSFVDQGRIPLELPVVTPLWLLSGIHMARVREVYHRHHFVNVSLAEVHLQNAEDEMNLQSEVLKMMFPKHAVQAVIHQCTAKDRSDTVFVQKFPALCVLNLRIDGFGPLLRHLEGSSVTLLQRIEDVVTIIENALKNCSSLSRIQSLGDSYLIVGPIVPSDEEEEESMDSGRRKASSGRPATVPSPQPQGRNQPVSPFEVGISGSPKALPPTNNDGDPLAPPSSSSKTQSSDERHSPTVHRRFKHEDELLNAALDCLEFLATLRHQLPLEFTAILNEGSAYGAVMGAERITFDVIGVATRQSMALISAASSGFTGATMAFKRVLTNLMGDDFQHTSTTISRSSSSPTVMSGATFERSVPSNLSFEEPQSWRVRGVGRVQIVPFSWQNDRMQQSVSGAGAQYSYSLSSSAAGCRSNSSVGSTGKPIFSQHVPDKKSEADNNSIGVSFAELTSVPIPPPPTHQEKQ